MSNIKVKIDPLTKRNFIPKYEFQRFSCRKNQIKYNNLRAKEVRKIKAPYDIILSNNRRILDNILEIKNYAIISRELLMALGYKFAYHTHISTINGVNAFSVYEFSIVPQKDSKYRIIRIQH